jgi:hypothetical protein
VRPGRRLARRDAAVIEGQVVHRRGVDSPVGADRVGQLANR